MSKTKTKPVDQSTPKNQQQKACAKQAGRGLTEFRSSHDKSFIVPSKIREALKQLGSSWCYEAEFLKLAGLCTTDLANYRDEFEEHIVMVERTKRVWCGTKDFAGKLREMV